MQTSTALIGSLACNPQLTISSNGDRRCYAKIAQSVWERQSDGRTRIIDTSYGDLVLHGAVAQAFFDQFTKGDTFIAEGQTRTRNHADGSTSSYFHASRIGHNPLTTPYTVDRDETSARRRTPVRRTPPPTPGAGTPQRADAPGLAS